MRELTPQEIMLIAGAAQTASLPPITVVAPPITGGDDPPPPPITGGDGTGGGSPPEIPHCIAPLANANRADRATILNNEGTMTQTGYVLPPAQFPNSGVTIGQGVDLGQFTLQQLTSWGLSAADQATLTPFIGLRGANAQAAINSLGAPTISAADATAVTNGAYQWTYDTVAANFNANAQNGMTFQGLPAQAQTAIVDAAYPSGPYLSSSAPHFYSDITSGNWAAAVNELNHWKADGSTDARHAADAALLQQGIDSGALHSDDSGCNP